MLPFGCIFGNHLLRVCRREVRDGGPLGSATPHIAVIVAFRAPRALEEMADRR